MSTNRSDPIIMKRGDTQPPVTRTLRNADGTAINLASANTVIFHMSEPETATPLIESPASVLDAANGRVQFSWQVGDTDVSGVYDAEFEVQFPNGNILTVPNDDMIVVTIVDDLA